MPELPEVETIRRQLEKLVVGKTISSIEILNKGSFRADQNSLIGKTIAGVGRKGKVLIITSSRAPTGSGRGDLGRLPRRPDLIGTPRNDKYGTSSKNLFIHLKMSGQLRYRYFPAERDQASPDKISISSPPDNRHLRVLFKFSDKDHLEFIDQRKFGWITDNPAVLPSGIDALDPELTAGKLSEILQSSNRPVKTILLDQSKIAGIGNIYASEILWEAGISPWARFKEEGKRKKVKGKKNEPVKFRKLHHAVRKVLTEAIKSGGSTMDDGLYLHVGGESGNYWSRRRVYDREGEPCLRCKSPVKKGVIGQRSTFWCPACQRLSA